MPYSSVLINQRSEFPAPKDSVKPVKVNPPSNVSTNAKIPSKAHPPYTLFHIVEDALTTIVNKILN